MKRKHEQGWAIAGRYGLYEGWQQTRIGMIAQHVRHTWDGRGDKPFPWTIRKLDKRQQELWKTCKKKGDRAVKVVLSYE